MSIYRNEGKPLRPEEIHFLVSNTIMNGDRWGLNKFFLGEGIPPDSQAVIDSYLALFPQANGDFLTAAKIGSTEVQDLMELYKEISELTLPQRVRDLGMLSCPQRAQQVTKILARNLRPSIIIARRKLATEETQYILFCPQGMLPESALQIAQRVARDKLTDLIAWSN